MKLESAGPVRAFRSSVSPAAVETCDAEFADLPELDFGPLRVRVPRDAVVRLAGGGQSHSEAVYFDFPNGTVRLGVLAAPRGRALWPERAEEIAASQVGVGAQVSSVWGNWGRELHIVHDRQYNWVIGVDGARWMLLGRATWTCAQGWELIDVMRSMIGTARVDRGSEPLPVRAPLLLTPPDAENEEPSPDPAAPYAAVVTMRTPDRDDEPEPGGPARPADEQRASDRAVRYPHAPSEGGPVDDKRSFTFPRRSVAAAAVVIGVVGGSIWLTHGLLTPNQAPPTAMPTPPAPRAPLADSGLPSAAPAPGPPAASKPSAPAVPKPSASAAVPVPAAPDPPRSPVRSGRGGSGPTPVEARVTGHPGQPPGRDGGERSERTRSRESDGPARQRSDSGRDEGRRRGGDRSDPKVAPRGVERIGPDPVDRVQRLPGQIVRIVPGL